MAPDQESQTPTEQSDISVSGQAPRSGRRPGRGRRGRGRRRRQKPAEREIGAVGAQEVSPEEPTMAPAESQSEVEREEAYEAEPESEPLASNAEPEVVHEPPEPQPRQPRVEDVPPSRPSQPASRLSIQQAIDDVNQIVANLKETQELMDEVLEMLEQFERQGNADEREIESLRRALRHIQRPREGGHHPQRGRQ